MQSTYIYLDNVTSCMSSCNQGKVKKSSLSAHQKGHTSAQLLPLQEGSKSAELAATCVPAARFEN